jgi:hypothetical protein
MAAKLLETARKLPAGPIRRDILKEIGKFRARINALKAKGKWPDLIQRADRGRLRTTICCAS